MSAQPLLALVGMFRDEAATIRETLSSARPFVDRWALLDTGSVDETREIVRRVMREVPGVLHEEPFVGYATTRNRVLELAAGCEDSLIFTLMLSGDETLHGGERLRAFLEANRDAADGVYCVEMRQGTSRWYYPRVLRVAAKWKYVGVVANCDPKDELHEVPVGPNGEIGGPIVPDCWIEFKESDPERRRNRIRERDIPILTRLARSPATADRDRLRVLFYLAESHMAAAGMEEADWERLAHRLAAMGLYHHFAEVVDLAAADDRGDDKARVGVALFRFLAIAADTKFYTSAEIAARAETLVRRFPWLPELRVLLAYHAARVDAQRGLMCAEDAIRVSTEATGKIAHVPTDAGMLWQANRIAAGCAKYMGNVRRAREFAAAGVEAGGPKDAFEEFLK